MLLAHSASKRQEIDLLKAQQPADAGECNGGDDGDCHQRAHAYCFSNPAEDSPEYPVDMLRRRMAALRHVREQGTKKEEEAEEG